MAFYVKMALSEDNAPIILEALGVKRPEIRQVFDIDDPVTPCSICFLQPSLVSIRVCESEGKHVFCERCITDWRRKVWKSSSIAAPCPVCRVQIGDPVTMRTWHDLSETIQQDLLSVQVPCSYPTKCTATHTLSELCPRECARQQLKHYVDLLTRQAREDIKIAEGWLERAETQTDEEILAFLQKLTPTYVTPTFRYKRCRSTDTEQTHSPGVGLLETRPWMQPFLSTHREDTGVFLGENDLPHVWPDYRSDNADYFRHFQSDPIVATSSGLINPLT